MFGPVRVLSLVFLGVFSAAPALAQTPYNVEGARLLGFGDAQRALVNGNDALYTNPAGIALANWYSVELGWLDDFEEGERRFNASIVDSHEKRLTGGVGYTYRRFRVQDLPDPQTEERGVAHRVDVSMASRMADGLAFGLTGRYLNVSHSIDDKDVPTASFGVFTFDAGLQWRHPSGFAVGLAGYNLTANDRPELPLAVGGGIAYGSEMVQLELDVRHDTRTAKPRFSMGASLLLGGTFVIRGGGAYDLATQTGGLSVGIGVITPQFSADLGFRQSVKSGVAAPGFDTERIFALALRGVPFM